MLNGHSSGALGGVQGGAGGEGVWRKDCVRVCERRGGISLRFVSSRSAKNNAGAIRAGSSTPCCPCCAGGRARGVYVHCFDAD